MVWKVLVRASDGPPSREFLRFEFDAIGSKDKFGFPFGGCGAISQYPERFRHRACFAGQDMDIVGLENAAEVGLVRRPRAETLDGGFLVPEGFKEGIGEVGAIERLIRKVGYCLFNFNGVQLFAPNNFDLTSFCCKTTEVR